ncbi:MAG TPA: hypothetical protein VFQ27_11435 [Xanthobacteraceae bacterium]|nr:hypothetical protein [Xanthobacteraceae bacterium]
MSRISSRLRRLGIGALAALTVAGSIAVSTADAQAHWRGRHFHHHHGGVGVGVAAGLLGGLVAGAALAGAPYYGGYYAYGRCWTERHEVIDPWGRVFIRPVRVCD